MLRCIFSLVCLSLLFFMAQAKSTTLQIYSTCIFIQDHHSMAYMSLVYHMVYRHSMVYSMVYVIPHVLQTAEAIKFFTCQPACLACLACLSPAWPAWYISGSYGIYFGIIWGIFCRKFVGHMGYSLGSYGVYVEVYLGVIWDIFWDHMRYSLGYI